MNSARLGLSALLIGNIIAGHYAKKHDNKNIKYATIGIPTAGLLLTFDTGDSMIPSYIPAIGLCAALATCFAIGSVLSEKK